MLDKDKEKNGFLDKLKKLINTTDIDDIEQGEGEERTLKEAVAPAQRGRKKAATAQTNFDNEKQDKTRKPFLKIVDSDPHFDESQESDRQETAVENEDDVELVGSHERVEQEKSKEKKSDKGKKRKSEGSANKKNKKEEESEYDEDDDDADDVYEDDAYEELPQENEKPYDLDKLTKEPEKRPRKKKKSFFNSIFKIGQALNAKPDEYVSDEELSDTLLAQKKNSDSEKPPVIDQENNRPNEIKLSINSEAAPEPAASDSTDSSRSEKDTAPIDDIDMSFATVQKVNGNIFIEGNIEPMYTIETASETFNVEIGKLSPILMKAYEAYLEPEVLEAKKAELARKQEEALQEEIITTATTSFTSTADELDESFEAPVNKAEVLQEDESDDNILIDNADLKEELDGEEQNGEKEKLSEKQLKKLKEKEAKLAKKERKKQLKKLIKENERKKSTQDKMLGEYGSPEAYSVSTDNPLDAEPIEDYETPQDARAVMVEINMNIRRLFFRTLVVGIIFAVAMCIAVIQRFFANSFEGIIANADMIYCVSNLVLLCIAVGVSAVTIKNGLIPLLGFKGNSDTAVSVAVVASLIQCVAAFFDSQEFYYGGQCLYVILVLFALALNSLGKLIMELRIKDNFRFVAQDRRKYAAAILNDKKSAEKMVHGTNAADPIIAYQRRTLFYSNFLKLSRAKDPSEMMASKFSLIGLVCAVIVAIAHGIIYKSVTGAFSVFAMVSCLCIPAACMIAVNLPMKLLCKKAIRSDAMIVGYPAVTQFVDTAAIMTDSRELYPRGSVKLVALKPYVTFNLESCLLNAAAVLKVANTSLTYVFSEVISSKEDSLPYVDSIKFEENKGLLGWIGGERVLIGRRELLEKYGVEVPPYEEERPFLDEHRNVTYIANAGQLVAMVVTAYAPDEKIKKEFCRLEDNGVSVIVRTADPNITAKRIAADYDLHIGSVKILPNSLGNICKAAIKEKSRKARCYIGTRGKLYSLARAVAGCIKIRSNINIAVIIQVLGIITGAIATSAVALASGDQCMNAFELLCFMLFWVLAAVFVPLIQRL